jgi:SAM-dependent methyltransferase
MTLRSHPEYARLVPGRRGERVGDFGCGQSLFYEALRRHEPPSVFLDLSMNALRTIDYGLRVVRADLNRLPFRDGAYDRILCIGVLHHLPARTAALGEMARVLRPAGALVLGVYAPRSLQARLRRLHDACSARPWRALLLLATALLILTRYRARGNPIDAREAMTRARDFLEVPFVRYAAPDLYAQEAAPAGLRLEATERIAAMNILLLRRA